MNCQVLTSTAEKRIMDGHAIIDKAARLAMAEVAA
jgi:hypothetical protein